MFEHEEQAAEFAKLTEALPKEWIAEWQKMDVAPVMKGKKVQSVYKQSGESVVSMRVIRK